MKMRGNARWESEYQRVESEMAQSEDEGFRNLGEV